MGPMGWVPNKGIPPTQSLSLEAVAPSKWDVSIARAIAETQGTRGMGHRSDDNDGHCFL